MAGFTREIKVNAPIEQVWEALDDIGSISRWNPGVVRSHVTTDKTRGVGAGRYCDLGGKNYLDEQVVEWEPGKALTMRVIGTNLPFQTADIRFRLQPEHDATMVTVSPEYTLKCGLAGRILDVLFVRHMYKKGMTALLAGLKAHVEQGLLPKGK